MGLTPDIAHLRQWIGRGETATDVTSPPVLARIAAFLGRERSFREGDLLPDLWHWFFFSPRPLPSAVGPDGHPGTGDMIPPFGLPRRMWGGSRLTFSHSLTAGGPIQRLSRVVKVDLKQGGSGLLGIVQIEHQILQDDVLCVTEWQDLVYREASTGPMPAPSAPACPQGSQHSREIRPDPVMLFRYSALTGNAHRIHYDRDYATRVEGYPALVVHGPLTATLLAGFACELRDGAPMTTFSFRGTSPLFDDASFRIHARADGRTTALWAESPAGGMAMTAVAEFPSHVPSP
ncbi:MaoC family dehydratase N-terminal domain-containing protein [Tistrella mobilis]|uniref:FAS1-like dehydratase domain-containing protein n=1 Tax=Tistrella mobilis TaxID=171437 RepID=UPI000C0B3EE4|nr:acyl-CoA dehydrogenase [Tistrella sp.]